MFALHVFTRKSKINIILNFFTKKILKMKRRKKSTTTLFGQIPYRVVIDEILIHIIFGSPYKSEEERVFFITQRNFLYSKMHSEVIENCWDLQKPPYSLDKNEHWGYFKSDPSRNLFFTFKSVYGSEYNYCLSKIHSIEGGVGQKFMSAILDKKLTNLKCLSADWAHVNFLFKNDCLSNLEYLKFNDYDYKSKMIKGITFDKLRTLVISGSKFVDFSAQNKLLTLKRLFLTDEYKFLGKGEHAERLSRFPSTTLLTKVSMYQVKHFNWEVFGTPEARNLRFIDLFYLDHRCDFYNVQLEQDLSPNFRCKRCHAMHFNPPPVPVKWICMPYLTTLMVTGCKLVSAVSFNRQTFENLRECYIKNCNLEIKEFKRFHSFPKIELMFVMTDLDSK
jgi:hypothetical protein